MDKRILRPKARLNSIWPLSILVILSGGFIYHTSAASLVKNGNITPHQVQLISNSVAIDSNPPVIWDLLPPEGSLLAESKPRIQASLSDDLSGIDLNSARFILDGQDITSFSITTPDRISHLPSSDLTDGVHSVSLAIRDKAGNLAQTSWSFTIDTTLPNIEINQPIDGSTISTNTPIIIITYSDTLSGIDLNSLHILINGRDKTFSFAITQTGATYQTPETEPLPEGENTIHASISDLSGNLASISSTFTVKSAPTPDTIEISQPADWFTITHGNEGFEVAPSSLERVKERFNYLEDEE